MKIPEIKKKINAFLVGEEGKISKKNVATIGVVLTGVAVSAALLSKTVSADSIVTHVNDLSVTYNNGIATGSHTHHGSHSSHSSY